jgi:endogenous inhibitor of DNA gyrase (YacG/DUF329 family)
MRPKKPLISKKCPMCGKNSGFSPLSNGQIKQSRARKFCSTSCALKFRHKDNISLSICPHCKKEFRKYPDGVARIYCSMKCYNGIRSKNLPSYEYPKKEKKNYKMKKINGKQIYYHRWVVEQHLGRKLTRSEVVHHINGDPHDNRIENLQIMSQSEHIKLERENLNIVPF